MPEETNPSFGPGEDSSATRQAQHTNSNDSPTDVNNNAMFGRSQGLTTDIAGKLFVQSTNRLSVLADHGAGKTVSGHGTHSATE